jgi:hypothetical protein
MDDVALLAVLYLVISMGFISIVWLRRGMVGITDRVIRGLFRSLTAMTTVALIFAIWIFISMRMGTTEEAFYWVITTVSLVAIFALISNAALAAKRIGDLYGFKVEDRK